MTTERLAEIADRYAGLVADLERAREHALTAERHFRAGEVPRGCAHALAILGHVRAVTSELEALAVLHAARSNP